MVVVEICKYDTYGDGRVNNSIQRVSKYGFKDVNRASMFMLEAQNIIGLVYVKFKEDLNG